MYAGQYTLPGGRWGGVAHSKTAAVDCLVVRYHRLNRDYQALHTLCYSLLQQQSRAGGAKGAELQPAYTLHMQTLFERFCAAYIRA